MHLGVSQNISVLVALAQSVQIESVSLNFLVTWLHQHLLFLLLSQLSLKMEGEKGTLEAGTKEQPDMKGPLTAEQLAAIEDEEILNNMVRGN